MAFLSANHRKELVASRQFGYGNSTGYDRFPFSDAAHEYWLQIPISYLDSLNFSWKVHGSRSVSHYPLVNSHITIENGPVEILDFPIAW